MRNSHFSFAALSLASLCFFVSQTPAVADGAQDYYLQRYNSTAFDLPQNAPSFGMAGASLATLHDSAAVLANPAGLGWMHDAEISGGWSREEVSGNDSSDYGRVETVTNSGHLVGALPLAPVRESVPAYGNIGFGISGFSADADDSGNLDSRTWRLHLAYAKALDDHWSLGYSLAYQHADLDSLGSTELTMDDGIRQALGAQYQMSPETLFGLSTAFGFGSYDGVRDDDSNNNIHSWNLAAGVSQEYGAGARGAFGIDYTDYSTEVGVDSAVWNFRVGVEQDFFEGLLKGRLGYRYAAILGRDEVLADTGTKNSKMNAFSFGLGLYAHKNFHIDYAAEYRHAGQGDWTHMVSAALPFSTCE